MLCLLLLRKFEQAVQGGIGNAMALQALQGLAGVVVGAAVAPVRVGKYLLVAGRTQFSGEIGAAPLQREGQGRNWGQTPIYFSLQACIV